MMVSECENKTGKIIFGLDGENDIGIMAEQVSCIIILHGSLLLHKKNGMLFNTSLII